MGKQPAAIIIVRHGTRLDQADKSWRATAEHPYDPPLSYGGWIQCQTLGARIDRELQSLGEQATEDTEKDDDDEQPQARPRKRRKIIIHSSPYKRCVQTSIAIAAGLRYPQPERLRTVPTAFQRSSLSHPRPSSTPSSDTAASPPQQAQVLEKKESDDKLTMKVDPYLGEWLSTGYFEDSKPPPSTDLIVQRAKETLTKPLEEIRGADLSAFLPVAESPDVEESEKELEFKQAAHEKGGLRGMAAAGHSLPHRSRTASFGGEKINSANQALLRRTRQRKRAVTVYSPPVPQYSLAPQDPIPAGYVAHARDSCVNPDLQWNSEDLGWGDGGAYPEEWSTMHVRFRLGLQKTLAYYQEYAPSVDTTDVQDDDIEEDIIVVLVTHQAGANALIRLVTGAPALHDVGVASLTLAVRRQVVNRLPSLSGTIPSPLGYDRESRRISRRGSLDLGLADDFEMRIIASTEHLRNGSNPLGLNSPRLGKSPAMAGRRMVGADSLDGFSIGDPLGWRSNSVSGLGRSSSQRGRNAETFARPLVTSGLWGSPASSPVTREPINESLEDLAPMSPRSRPSTPSLETESIPDTSLDTLNRSRSNTVQSAGLWGSNNGITKPGSGEGMWGASVAASGARAKSPAKRRWTSLSNDP